MSKYWDEARIQRVRERKKRKERKAVEKSIAEFERRRTFTPGDAKKNARLMLDALALPLRRQMVARLAQGGAMSLSKLAEPFRLTLPTAQFHLGLLARAGIVETHKQGRIRFIVYRSQSLVGLADFLTTNAKNLT